MRTALAVAAAADSAAALVSGSVGQPRLAVPYYENFFARHGVTLRDVEQSRPVWPTSEGLKPLTLEDIERLIAIEDPVPWAWLNLTEKEGVWDDEANDWYVRAGDPWALLPVQAKLARLRGNLIVEAAAGIGKSRNEVLRVLHAADTCEGGASCGIAADSDSTLEPIWEELLFQLDKNPRIGGGIKDKRVKPFRQLIFHWGLHFEMRLCGDKGQQFRGWHVSDFLDADECAMWKNPKQFSELYRAANPGCELHLSSTPDGDYSSTFFAACARAESLDGRSTFAAVTDDELASAPKNSPKFKKINIRKSDLPHPFWNQREDDRAAEMHGGRETPGYITNVLGAWGSPSFSVFPAAHLEACTRKRLLAYRVVRLAMDRKESRFFLDAARLSSDVDTIDGERQEEILEHAHYSFTRPEEIAKRLCQFFPDISDLVAPVIVAGADLGSAADPTEIQFARAAGGRLSHLFRAHLRGLKWTEQEIVFRFLDHYSGHRVQFGIDNGSAGSMLVQALTVKVSPCPVCERSIDLEERVRGFGFGEANDFIDMETGHPVMNPDRTDSEGAPVPLRLLNKESSTRYLEKIMQSGAWEVANDSGAGDPKSSGPQLLMNHTSHGLNARGERKFKDIDDHYPDSWRQLALAYVYSQRGPWVPEPSEKTVATATARRRSAADDAGFAAGGRLGSELAGGDGFFGSGGTLRGSFGDFL